MRKRLLDYDPETATTTWHYYDDHTDETYIEEIQDVQPYLEINKALQNVGTGGSTRGVNEYSSRGIKKEWWHVASIPNGVIAQWLQKGINVYEKDHWPKVKQLLNSPEWRYLRTGTGRI